MLSYRKVTTLSYHTLTKTRIKNQYSDFLLGSQTWHKEALEIELLGITVERSEDEKGVEKRLKFQGFVLVGGETKSRWQRPSHLTAIKS